MEDGTAGFLVPPGNERALADAILALAEALLVYSHSQALLKLSVDDLLDWLKTFHEFLSQRDSDVKVRRFTPDNIGCSFLLVNTPDVPYLVDSLNRFSIREILTDSIQRRFTGATTQKITIHSVMEGSRAEKAGIKPGDQHS